MAIQWGRTQKPRPTPTPTPTPDDDDLDDLASLGPEELSEVEADLNEALAALAESPPVAAPESPKPAPKPEPEPPVPKPVATYEQLRDPDWCFSHQAELKAIAKRAANLPMSKVPDAFVDA